MPLTQASERLNACPRDDFVARTDGFTSNYNPVALGRYTTVGDAPG